MMTTKTLTRRPQLVTCKFCGEKLDLHLEGNTYRDGSSAHEECEDIECFYRENAEDLK